MQKLILKAFLQSMQVMVTEKKSQKKKCKEKIPAE